MTERKMPVLRHWLNYAQEIGERNMSPSETVPDQSLTIPEIMHRFSAGRSVGLSNDLHYTGDDFLPEVRSMDLTEQADALEAAKERARKLEESYNEKMDLRKKAIKEKQERLNRLLELEAMEKDNNKNLNMSPNNGGTTKEGE